MLWQLFHHCYRTFSLPSLPLPHYYPIIVTVPVRIISGSHAVDLFNQGLLVAVTPHPVTSVLTPKQSGIYLPSPPPYKTPNSVEIPGLWGNTITSDEGIGVHECFKFLQEKVSLLTL